ncbi:MAG: acyltransferase family protein, partial [Flavobacterium sp.]
VLYSIFIKTSNYQKMHFFDIIKKLIRSVYFGSAYHLWYVYMLLGLILIIPILNAWIMRAKKNEIHYFLLLWLVTLSFKNLGMENYKPPIEFLYFSGYVGYLVLGYYLSVIEFKNTKKWKIIALLLFISGSLITFLGTYWLSFSKGKTDSSLYDFFSFNVLLASIGIFIFFRLSDFFNRKSNLVIAQISHSSYGIYLVHVLVLWILDSFAINASFITPLIGIPITVLLCLSISTIIIKIINMNKFGSYISG